MKHLHTNTNKNHATTMHHYTIMFFIMILAGLLSTMNVWVDKYDDIRFSMNDVYMILLMTGWMFFFMGIVYKEIRVILIGIGLVAVNLYCIRNQVLITESQYKLGMIPHHSMAIHMSKKLIEKENSIPAFIQSIIKTQEDELLFLKKE